MPKAGQMVGSSLQPSSWALSVLYSPCPWPALASQVRDSPVCLEDLQGVQFSG